ncbi:MAG: hypothetical protein J3R72DRAFT_442603 [Linnemannia gamsii]|nr:MAG: hypothetical protein J3R72DRAFT_442603 [Linnemannia gamsii]
MSSCIAITPLSLVLSLSRLLPSLDFGVEGVQKAIICLLCLLCTRCSCANTTPSSRRNKWECHCGRPTRRLLTHLCPRFIFYSCPSLFSVACAWSEPKEGFSDGMERHAR